MEKSLWEKILETVSPLKRRSKNANFGRVVLPVKVRKRPVDDADNGVVEAVSFLGVEDVSSMVGRRSVHTISEAELSLGDASRIDKNLKREVMRRFVPDARLDLHGKTLETGYRTFVAFVCRNYDAGYRRLLVVTGKGTPSRGTGVIRQNLPKWINDFDVSSKILYVTYARVEDGGDGAVYILLRKR